MVAEIAGSPRLDVNRGFPTLTNGLCAIGDAIKFLIGEPAMIFLDTSFICLLLQGARWSMQGQAA
jgi:hypothetical protein